MHDLNEGVVPFLLHHLFNYCIEKKVFTEQQLKEAVKFYSYAPAFRKSIPSDLKLYKSNLNQNASQMKCLLLNLPFILFEYRNNQILLEVWSCVQSLIDIFHIVYSSKITKSVLTRLNECVKTHLENIQNNFKVKLIPKHHFMLHYATVIRLVGPINDLAMFHYEQKHKMLKEFAKNGNNFININKTVAIRHQEVMSHTQYIEDRITYSKRKIVDDEWMTNNSSYFQHSNEIKEVKFASVNSINYRPGEVVSYNGWLYEIEKILCVGSDVLLLSIKLKCFGFDEFSRAIITKNLDPIEKEAINVSTLKHKKVYTKKVINQTSFVIIDNLDLEFQ